MNRALLEVHQSASYGVQRPLPCIFASAGLQLFDFNAAAAVMYSLQDFRCGPDTNFSFSELSCCQFQVVELPCDNQPDYFLGRGMLSDLDFVATPLLLVPCGWVLM
jgi:hypothetical protein